MALSNAFTKCDVNFAIDLHLSYDMENFKTRFPSVILCTAQFSFSFSLNDNSCEGDCFNSLFMGDKVVV